MDRICPSTSPLATKISAVTPTMLHSAEGRFSRPPSSAEIRITASEASHRQSSNFVRFLNDLSMFPPPKKERRDIPSKT